MKVNEIIDKLMKMDQKDGELTPDPNVVETTGCEDIEIEVLDREHAIFGLTGCGISEKIKGKKLKK